MDLKMFQYTILVIVAIAYAVEIARTKAISKSQTAMNYFGIICVLAASLTVWETLPISWNWLFQPILAGIPLVFDLLDIKHLPKDGVFINFIEVVFLFLYVCLKLFV